MVVKLSTLPLILKCMLRINSMTEAVKKFKETLEKVGTVSIKTGDFGDLSKILAASLLHNLFIKLGKKSSVENWSSSEVFFGFLGHLFENSSVNNNFAETEHILISLDTKKIPVSELNYEKDGDTLKIILKGKNILSHEGITIEKEKDAVDMLILLDPPAGEIENILAKNPHKDVVKITSKDRNLSNKISDIILAFYEEIPAELKEALWLLIKEENKEAPYPKAETLALEEKLARTPMNFEKIAEAKNALFGQDFWKLLGRALSRSEYEKDIRTIWTFLPQSDTEKTNMKSEWLLSIFREIRNLRKEAKFSALLWEEEKNGSRSISAIVGGGEIGELAGIASALGSAPASNYFYLSGFKAFSEAEIKIRSGLKKFAL
ncbi:MAG: hypothetical protein UW30_C0004G0010 [Candidatus Giovannonibacteria bacterium GW2011_GWA2_44_13b]|uniref:Uncharacterized protein n=2 Tax=Candidatus Giovannoniibacteriota TaxID=1752738 RepID=A0A0G1H319_9BACT|nr:MAG: hypothetical protein UW30_C0004G0010 [Candidatus Giovannonibacteria bacterium GW2011_GWA2_44_13b]